MPDTRTRWLGTALLVLLTQSPGVVCARDMPRDLASLSLEDLGKVVVSSVTKSDEPLSDAPAAVYVIGHDDIERSGATRLADILRLAPNLEIFQTSPSNYVVSARGLSGNDAAQNFPDKLLVLIDGRSVYSPIFSGMYWDDQYVLPADIDRIEVISGPGGALWGANAVNGVINIITRKSGDTPGGMVDLAVGNLQREASAQYAGMLGKQAHYRVYARDMRHESFEDSSGRDAGDGWRSAQTGMRVDWDLGASDTLMFQGDLHDAHVDQSGPGDSHNVEADVLARWEHAQNDTSRFRVQSYYDRVHRRSDGSGSGFSLDTWDLEAQQNLVLGEHNTFVWGVGDRIYHYAIVPRIGVASSLLWNPEVDTQMLANAFAQDQVAITRNTELTLGLKAEHDPYAGLSWMPNVRWSWKPAGKTLLWAAASRAVRTPTPFDVDVVEKLGTQVFLTGNPHFKRERLTAYEAGWRAQVATRATVSVSTFYNVYDDLKTIEVSPTLFPLMWGNGMEGHTWGVEAWGSYAVNEGWRLSAGFTMQREHLRFKPGASGLLGVAQAGDDPGHQGFVRSSLNLSDRWTLDMDLRGVSALPDPKVPGYVELDARLGFQVSDKLNVSLSGSNLLRRWHQEYVFPQSDRIGRSLMLDTRLSF